MFLGSRKSTYSAKKEPTVQESDEDLTPMHLRVSDLQSKSDIPINNLEELIISRRQILSVSDISSMTSLSRLELPNCSLTTISELKLENLTNLTYLNLSYNQLTDISSISSCARLQVLNLSHNMIKSISALECKNLKALIVNHNQLQRIPAVKEHLKDCNTLVASHNEIDSLQGLNQYRNLRKLVLGNNKISNLCVPEMRFLKKIETFDLSHNQVSSLDVIAWKHLTQLKKLKLSFNKVEAWDEVLHLQRLSNLSELWLFGNPVYESAKDWEETFPNLKKLDDKFISEEEQRKFETRRMQRQNRSQVLMDDPMEDEDMSNRYEHSINQSNQHASEHSREHSREQSNKYSREYSAEKSKPRNELQGENNHDRGNKDKRSDKYSKNKDKTRNDRFEKFEGHNKRKLEHNSTEKPQKRARYDEGSTIYKQENNQPSKEYKKPNEKKSKYDSASLTLSQLSKRNDIEHHLKWRTLSKDIPTLKSKAKIKHEAEERRKNSRKSEKFEDFGVFKSNDSNNSDEHKKGKRYKRDDRKDGRNFDESKSRKDGFNNDYRRDHDEEKRSEHYAKKNNTHDYKNKQDPRQKSSLTDRYSRDANEMESNEDYRNNKLNKNYREMRQNRGNPYTKFNSEDKKMDYKTSSKDQTASQAPPLSETKQWRRQDRFSTNSDFEKGSYNLLSTASKANESNATKDNSTKTDTKDDYDWDKLFTEATSSKSEFQKISGTERPEQGAESGGNVLGDSKQPKKMSSSNIKESGVIEKRSSSLKKLDRIKKQQTGLMNLLQARGAETVDTW